MAEEKKTTGKQGWFQKTINWFVSLPGRIAKAFNDMVAELRKVTWPSKKKLISSCITVMLFMLIVGVIVSVLDLGSATAVNGLYKLGHPVPEYVVTEDDVNGDTTTEDGEAGATDGTVEVPADGETTEVPESDGTAETETTGTDEGAVEGNE